MKLFLLSQGENTNYDTYDSCVVCAEDETDAKTIHPTGGVYVEGGNYPTWARHISAIECVEIGTANELQKRGVICSSYNAG